MAEKYFVGVKSQTNDHHAVHKEGCPFLPDERKRIYLGEFSSGAEAAGEGRRYFTRAKECLFCSKEHKQHDDRYIPGKIADENKIPARPWQQSMVCCLN